MDTKNEQLRPRYCSWMTDNSNAPTGGRGGGNPQELQQGRPFDSPPSADRSMRSTKTFRHAERGGTGGRGGNFPKGSLRENPRHMDSQTRLSPKTLQIKSNVNTFLAEARPKF